MTINMKMVSKNEVLENSYEIKTSLLQNIVKIKEYMEYDYDEDISTLLSMFYNAIPFDYKIIQEKTQKVLAVLNLFKEKENLLFNVIKALELGFTHHVEHLTTSNMASQLGISTQAIHAHIYDINNPEEVEMAKSHKKKKFIPVKKYPKLILAEKQDFDVFKEWFLIGKYKGDD